MNDARHHDRPGCGSAFRAAAERPAAGLPTGGQEAIP
jgi:hypothetical protein